MSHAIVVNGEFIRRIGSENIAWDDTHFQPAHTLTDEEKAQFGVVDFAYTPMPSYNELTEDCADTGNALVDGVWSRVWTVTPALGTQIRARGTLAANAALAETLAAGFTFNTILWHCDAEFQSQIQGFILAYIAGVLAPTDSVTIRSKDNANHSLTQAEVGALAGALMVHVQTAFATCWATKDALP